MRHCLATLLLSAGLLASSAVLAEEVPVPLPVKVVIVSMFEVGADSGDTPGELQLWKQRLGLDTVYPMPAAHHDVLADPEAGVIATVTGQGTARAAASIMALGSDPRFDLSEAYWLIAGISGVDPAVTTVGSAVWTDWVIDGDLAYRIDAREIPADWSTGTIPYGRDTPFEPPPPAEQARVWQLNPQLLEWAYALTRDTKLQDTEAMQALRSRYRHQDHEPARGQPEVLVGANVSATSYWHGALLNRWARRWVDYWTQGRARFATSAMEDSGTLQSLEYLDRAGRADAERVLILRTGSNFTTQPSDLSAAQNLARDEEGYSAYIPSLEAAFAVGNRVVSALLEDWSRYRHTLPSAKE